MFDVIKAKIECPFCGIIHDNWQTKDFEQLLLEYDISDRVPMKEGTVNFYTYCAHRIHRDYRSSLSLHMPVYKNVYIVWLEVFAPVRKHRIVRDVRRWKMFARPQEGHHLSVVTQEVRVRKFNLAKRRAEIERIGRPITEVELGREHPVRLKRDGEVIRTKVMM